MKGPTGSLDRHRKTSPDHILKVAGRTAKLLLENYYIRVIRITMGRGQEFGPRTYLEGVSYNLDEAKIRAVEADGKASTVKFERWKHHGTTTGYPSE